MKKITILALTISLLSAVSLWYWCLSVVQNDVYQGSVYKILYLHVPSAFCAFLCSFAIFIMSILFLLKKSVNASLLQKSFADTGFLFTFLTLASGSIWGRATWGVWWTWDARLTTTFILGLLYAGYLMLWSLTDNPKRRAYICSVIGILIFIDVPIIYKSVLWWRTLHQPASILSESGTQMSSDILYPLIGCCFLLWIINSWIVKLRYNNLKLKEELNASIHHSLN